MYCVCFLASPPFTAVFGDLECVHVRPRDFSMQKLFPAARFTFRIIVILIVCAILYRRMLREYSEALQENTAIASS